jgi:hypothetical protein
MLIDRVISICHKYPSACNTPYLTYHVLLLLAQAAADRARQEVLFWKNELDDTVAEKNLWKAKFYDMYHELERVRQNVGQLQRDNEELKFILERTMQADLKTIREEAKPSSTPCAAASPLVSGRIQAPSKVVKHYLQVELTLVWACFLKHAKCEPEMLHASSMVSIVLTNPPILALHVEQILKSLLWSSLIQCCVC